jgi:hypothetical protein
MKQWMLISTAAFAVTLTIAGGAVAAAYPPQTTDLQVARSAVSPGGVVPVAVQGFQPNVLVRFVLRRVGGSAVIRLGGTRSDADGVVEKPVRLPERVARGRWVLVAFGKSAEGGRLRARAVLTVR